jgi:hypothetical protein
MTPESRTFLLAALVAGGHAVDWLDRRRLAKSQERRGLELVDQAHQVGLGQDSQTVEGLTEGGRLLPPALGVPSVVDRHLDDRPDQVVLP